MHEITELRDIDIAQWVRSEEELDALLDYVQRTTLPPEEPFDLRSLQLAPPPVPSETVDLDRICATLRSTPSPAFGDPALEPLWLRTSLAPPPSTPTIQGWQIAAITMVAFTLGSLVTLISG